MWVKICGITGPGQALACAEAGADAIGLMFARSKRAVSPAAARSIVEVLPRGVEKTGVFADAPMEEVMEIQRLLGLDLLQFHGNESPAYCSAFPVRVIKAFRIARPRDLEAVERYRGKVWACLLDSYAPGEPGGTGKPWNWALIDPCLLYSFSRRFIVAGGLNPQNVLEAVKFTRPYGVDVSSGVEKAPGEKDPNLIQKFIQQARRRV